MTAALHRDLKRLEADESRASVLDRGSPLPLFNRETCDAKAAEGCRSPKPRGISPPVFHPRYRFY
jgi:hypothetical protein